MTLHSEISEQPDIAARLLENQWHPIRVAAEHIRESDIRYVYIAARGTSDHAAIYAKYVFGVYNRLPVALAAPSLFTLFDSPPMLKNALVIGISQSGESPDVVSVVAEGKRQGALTIAITNAPKSPLAEAAGRVIDVQAGEEKAVAATKTYTAELMAIAMLSAAVAGDADRVKELVKLPELMRQSLETEDAVKAAAEKHQGMEECAVLGRGFNYATAFEWSLKLKELATVVAEPYSPADFRHGPIKLAQQPDFPILAIAPDDPSFDDMLGLIKKLSAEMRTKVLMISDRKDALDAADDPIKLPDGIARWLTPLVCIVPAQLFCLHLTQAKGLDTENPRGLTKVTRTL